MEEGCSGLKVCPGVVVQYHIVYFWVGELHRLYRKATAGHPEATAFLPAFREVIENVRTCSFFHIHILMSPKVVDRWNDAISSNPSLDKSAVLDVNNWMARASLDVYVLNFSLICYHSHHSQSRMGKGRVLILLNMT